MALTGPKPIPTALKRLAGNGKYDSGHRLIKQDIQPEKGAPDCPKKLKGEAAAEWKRIVKELEPTGVLTKADRAALTLYCMAWSQLIEASENIKANGGVITCKNGELGANPYRKQFMEAAKVVKSFLAEFGGTPSARARIPAAELEDEDDFFG